MRRAATEPQWVLTQTHGGYWLSSGLRCSGWSMPVRNARNPARVLRHVRSGMMVAMFAIFRRTTHCGQIAWIEGSYPEILGLIGCTYFVVCVLYIPTRRWLWAPLAWFLALLAFERRLHREVDGRHASPSPYILAVFQRSHGLHHYGRCSTSVIFLGAHRWQTFAREPFWRCVRHFRRWWWDGFSPRLASPKSEPLPPGAFTASEPRSCCSHALLDLRCEEANCMGLLRASRRFEYVADISTARFLLLPLGLGIGISYFETHFNFGWLGAVRSALFTAFILAIAAVFTRLKVRLQL